MSELLKTTDWYKKDPDEALDFVYSQPDWESGYAAFEYFMDNYPDLEIDWLEAFEDFKDVLLFTEQIQKILSFVNWYSNKNPEDYQQRYEFIERNICDYCFLRNDHDLLKERIDFIQKNPVPAIDTLMIRLLYQLIYHGHYEMAVSFSNAVWKPISQSEQLIGYPEYEFINTLYVNKLQECYEAWKDQKPFDKEAFFKEVVELGFDEDNERLNHILNTLKGQLDKSLVEQSIKDKRYDHMFILNIHFLKYMLEKYELPFILSEWMWNFVNTKNLFGKSKKTKGVEDWFYVNRNHLDKHVAQKMDMMLASNQLEVFGKVWGLDFVFEFLHEQGLLSDQHYEQMQDNIASIKRSILRIEENDLWQMTFILDWPKVSGIQIDAEERNFFHSTFESGRTWEENEWKDMADYSSSSLDDFDMIEKDDEDAEWSEAEENRVNLFPEYEPQTTVVREGPKIGRNDPCPCGSGKKYKKCCLAEEE